MTRISRHIVVKPSLFRQWMKAIERDKLLGTKIMEDGAKTMMIGDVLVIEIAGQRYIEGQQPSPLGNGKMLEAGQVLELVGEDDGAILRVVGGTDYE